MTTREKIRKTFRKACADYHLLEDGDRILVAISGGKDSLLLARLLAEQARIYRPHIQVEAAHVVMDNAFGTGSHGLTPPLRSGVIRAPRASALLIAPLRWELFGERHLRWGRIGEKKKKSVE